MPARRVDRSSPSLRLLQLHLGGDRNFCYLAACPATGEAAAVDPAFRPDELAAIARDQGLRIALVLITHGHLDHAAGAAPFAERMGARLLGGALDGIPGAEPVPEDEEIALGTLRVRALATPGHTPGHTCYLVAGHLFTGDLLFCGKVGGTGAGFPGSSAGQEWRSLGRLLELPDATVVLPGHDFWGGEGARPVSTIGFERRHNPFLRVPDLAGFEELKAGWAQYKRSHGIR